jgi:hypothetical protein
MAAVLLANRFRPWIREAMIRVLFAGFATVAALAAFPGAARAQEAWRIERPARNVAPAVIRSLGDETFFGFSCLRRRWSFFFAHVAPAGGDCPDHEACERAVTRVTNVLAAEGMAERSASFDLFSNAYYLDDDVSAAEMGALVKAPALIVKLDPRLATMWGRAELALPLDGLAEILDADPRRFDCPR